MPQLKALFAMPRGEERQELATAQANAVPTLVVPIDGCDRHLRPWQLALSQDAWTTLHSVQLRVFKYNFFRAQNKEICELFGFLSIISERVSIVAKRSNFSLKSME